MRYLVCYGSADVWWTNELTDQLLMQWWRDYEISIIRVKDSGEIDYLTGAEGSLDNLVFEKPKELEL